MKSGLGRGIVLAILLTLSARGIYASAWQKPVPIDAERDNAFRTGIAFDPVGNAMAVFEQNSDGVYKLYATRYAKKDKRWERPVAIDAATGNAYRGKVASDKTGNAIAVFKQKSKNGYRIYAARYIKDRGWDSPVAMTTARGLWTDRWWHLTIAARGLSRYLNSMTARYSGYTRIFIPLKTAGRGLLR